MPFVLPILAAVATAAPAIGAGAAIAGTAYELSQGGGGGGGQPQVQPAATPQQPDQTQLAQSNAAAQQSEQASIARQVPGIQSQLGGSVSPDYYAEEAAREAGFPGDSNIAKTALANFLGLGSLPENQGTAPGNQFGGSQGFQFNPLSVIQQDQGPQQDISGGFS